MLAKIVHLLTMVLSLQTGKGELVETVADNMPACWVHRPEPDLRSESEYWDDAQQIISKLSM